MVPSHYREYLESENSGNKCNVCIMSCVPTVFSKKKKRPNSKKVFIIKKTNSNTIQKYTKIKPIVFI